MERRLLKAAAPVSLTGAVFSQSSGCYMVGGLKAYLSERKLQREISMPPNIVYLMFDQLKASATSISGNTIVPCPFVNRMASMGISFSDVYTASSICTPSRTSVFTGVHPLVHQVTCHQNRAPYNLPQLSEILQDAGYYTAVIGHYEQSRNLTRGWHEQIDMNQPGPLQEALKVKYSGGRRDVAWSAGGCDCDAEEGNSYLVAERAIMMLDEAVASQAPFFLHVAFDDPHPPYFVPPPYDSMVDPEDVKLPDMGDGYPRPDWQLRVREQGGTARANEYDVRKTVAVYYGMIAYADDQMRRMYQALKERGLLENTWIIIGSDHGDYTGEKGMFNKTESLYECLLHVPLVIVPPASSQYPRAERFTGLIENVDLFPTILGMAGVSVPDYAQGKDLLAWVKSRAQEPLHDYVFAQVGDYHGSLKTTYPTGMPEAGRHPSLLQGARTRQFSYVRDPDYGDEAYDLRNDPKELNNLLRQGGGPEPADVTDLRTRVDDWEKRCLRLREELGVIPGYRGFTKGWEGRPRTRDVGSTDLESK